MKKKYVVIFSVLIMFVTIIVLVFLLMKKDDSNNYSLSNTNKNNIGSFLTLMLEQSDGSYQKSTSNTWPTGNYAFNSTLSGCERGGELKWDREANIVKLLSNKSDKCYVYFDLYNAVQISNVSTSSTYNSITITVTTSGGENQVDKYYFSIDEGNSYQESTSPSYTFSNLTSNHEYVVQVYAKDTQGYESNEEVVEVTTDNYVNPTVNTVTVTDTSTSSISVSVSASGGTNNVATYYYSINNGAYTSSSSKTHTFSGLSKGTTYSIKVYVKDSNGVDSGVYTISTETKNTILLADYIKGLYTSQGSNGLYYHTSSLANSAADNSYRYAGANPNNYVCFGSDAATCPSGNLYRIIGVFGSEVKLIKSTSYGKYEWDSGGDDTWSTSDIKNTLNTTYLNSLGTTWSNKIATHTWYVGGYPTNKATPRTFYNAESSGTTWRGKIGLMYASDYGYSASNSYWISNLSSYNSATSSNWLYLMDFEWTITPGSSFGSSVYYLYSTGSLSGTVANNGFAARPVFYLNSNITYVSGDGTQSNPIRLN